jgi:hypothetical protein
MSLRADLFKIVRDRLAAEQFPALGVMPAPGNAVCVRVGGEPVRLLQPCQFHAATWREDLARLLEGDIEAMRADYNLFCAVGRWACARGVDLESIRIPSLHLLVTRPSGEVAILDRPTFQGDGWHDRLVTALDKRWNTR